MNRADRLERALKEIVALADRNDSHEGFLGGIALAALDLDRAWPGAPEYRSPEDQKLAHEWLMKHQRADQLVYNGGYPVAAIYIEPVGEHYAAGRRFFEELARTIRHDDDYYDA